MRILIFLLVCVQINLSLSHTLFEVKKWQKDFDWLTCCLVVVQNHLRLVHFWAFSKWQDLPVASSAVLYVVYLYHRVLVLFFLVA